MSAAGMADAVVKAVEEQHSGRERCEQARAREILRERVEQAHGERADLTRETKQALAYAAISATLAFLPSTIIPPSYRKQNPAASPILFFALTSSAMSLVDLDEFAVPTVAATQAMKRELGLEESSNCGAEPMLTASCSMCA